MKIKYTFLVGFVLFFSLFLSRNAAAQSESGNSEKLTNENLISDQLVAQRTRQLMTHSFHGRGTAILGDNNQFFLINSNPIHQQHTLSLQLRILTTIEILQNTLVVYDYQRDLQLNFF